MLEDEIRDFGYSRHGNHNTSSLLRTTECHGSRRHEFPRQNLPSPGSYPSDANQKYKGLVRQLPSPACTAILLDTFFSAVNWQYDLIDEVSFREQLAAWESVWYADLQVAFERLAPELLVFPALLLQVLAQALLFHPPVDQQILTLMTINGMTFQDLAAEYSSAGAELLAVLGKRNITIATVQASLLRASFLKSSGRVIEAWHTLGATIRDAQEIGLHTGRALAQSSPRASERGAKYSNDDRHRLWVVLHIWDIHMAVVLGRPIATSLDLDMFAGTIEDDYRRHQLFSHWQTEYDPPRPFDVILAGYNAAYRYFQDIHRLEQNGGRIQDYHMVERIDATIKRNLNLLPSWCRLENPSTKFDQTPGCQWLPFAREGLASLIHLVLLTLHRPYIFTVAKSRAKALEAAISILQEQETLFRQTEPYQSKIFNPVYASFDAIVLIAAIYLAFPNESQERRPECLDVVEKGMQRLSLIGQHNAMAKSAHRVVRNLFHRLQHSSNVSDSAKDSMNTPESPGLTSPTRHLPSSNVAFAGLSFDAILPPRPTHDLFYDNISSPQVPAMNPLDCSVFDSPPTDTPNTWIFEGGFSDDSFWSFMNGVEPSD